MPQITLVNQRSTGWFSLEKRVSSDHETYTLFVNLPVITLQQSIEYNTDLGGIFQINFNIQPTVEVNEIKFYSLFGVLANIGGVSSILFSGVGGENVLSIAA